jgi:hypothetical protein
MNWAPIIMAAAAALLTIAGVLVVTRPGRTPQSVYIKRISATMLFAGAVMLALFAFGLERAASPSTSLPNQE